MGDLTRAGVFMLAGMFWAAATWYGTRFVLELLDRVALRKFQRELQRKAESAKAASLFVQTARGVYVRREDDTWRL